ncbi:calcium-binding protein [Shimia marina]|uniref:Hemolysin, plasmid n=1 Tax=Shimia marina TaxID=321267 RepID=A0A0N7LSG2_9RHOB|nr:calcium-binding protein [Shimia marina]CUH53532.1 Hemolysin, plasmid [Shimia marina]SFD74947.1 Hemolysin-type calcium-binding repeat-containing protein [Shimia marina]
MLMLSLLLTGVAVGAMVGAFDSDDSDESTGSPEPSDERTPIQRDGEVGELISGNDSDEQIFGTNGPDILSGQDGDDSLRGRDGIDFLLGGDGEDSLYGQTGTDELFGGNGDDELHGGRGDDVLYGAAGNDTLYGGPGDDDLVGADITNRDLEIADRHDDRTPSSPLRFEVPTTAEANVLDGGEGDDTLLLGEGDVATGGEGDDDFDVGHWVDDEDNVPLVTDFNEEDDTISVLYPAGETPPTITLGSENNETLVYADGQLVLRVQGDGGPFFASDVVLSAVTLT